jgi:hypothetical protein
MQGEVAQRSSAELKHWTLQLGERDRSLAHEAKDAKANWIGLAAIRSQRRW